MWPYIGIQYLVYIRYRLAKHYSNIKWKGNNLPGSVIIPFRDKFKIRQMIGSRPLLLHWMLKQGQTWYPLSNVWEIMEIEDNAPESIEMCIGPWANMI